MNKRMSVHGIINKEVEERIATRGRYGDISERTSAKAAKYGYTFGKYALRGGHVVARGAANTISFSKDLINDVKLGVLTNKQARSLFISRAGNSISESGNSIANIIKDEFIEGVERFQGSDDLGMQAITKTKDVVVKTKRAIRVASEATHTTKLAAEKTANAVKVIARSVKKAATYLFSAKGAAIAGAILLPIIILLAVATTVTSIIPTISLKSDNKELTKTYEHITKLDAELTYNIRGEKDSLINSNIDVFTFYINGSVVSEDNINIYTNADLILLYFDVKYDDYAFDKIIYGWFGGDNVKNEITALHETLNYYNTFKWSTTVEYTYTDTEIDPETGDKLTYTVTVTTRYMDIYVYTKSFETYLYEHNDSMLTKEQQERMYAMKTVGSYTSKVELGNPFGDDYFFISSRWGWRIHPIRGGVSLHNGVDIPKPYNTKIYNVLYGFVDTVSYDASGHGNYVIVVNGNRKVLYAHMSSVVVSPGQLLHKNDIVGYVGTTGSSTGPHLHLEYYIEDGFCTNPGFFLEGASRFGTGTAIINVAESQIGNTGGETYWRWYGFVSRVEWCAAFVSWCAEQGGYISSGAVIKFASCGTGTTWFKNNGLWQYGGGAYIPQPGDYIFFDWNADGGANHVGLVEICENNIVYTIEGNSSDSVRRRFYNLYDNRILGYGTPLY